MSLTRKVKEAAIAVLAAMFAAAPVSYAASPSILITAPAAGTTFQTGQTIDVAVSVIAPNSIKTIALIGQGRLGAAKPQAPSKIPATFLLPIPASLQPGPYSLTAIGYGANATIVAQTNIQIQIDNPSAQLNLITAADALTFEAIGERLPLRIGGATSGGAPVDLTQSTGVSFTSSDPTVGAVDSAGLVTAVAPGNTTINVKLGSGIAAIPIRVLTPALMPSATSLAFGDQAMGTSGATLSFSLTNKLSYPLKILSVQSSPDFPADDECVAASPIPPGNSCTIKVTFMPLAQGLRAGFVTIGSSAVIAATRIVLNGLGIPTAGASSRVEPAKIDFDAVKHGHTVKRKFTIINTGSATLNVYVAPLMGSFQVASQAGLFPIPAGHKHKVRLTFSPTEPPARKGGVTRVSTTLNITTNDPLHPVLAIRLTGKAD